MVTPADTVSSVNKKGLQSEDRNPFFKLAGNVDFKPVTN
jgi:hypothetical protein